MSWGNELWDQFDNLTSHAHRGITFCERFANFTKDRVDIENDYAAKLKKLVKNFQPKKKEKDEDAELTVSKSFQAVLKETHDMAGQHEVIAENLSNGVVTVLQEYISELKKERKKYSQEESKFQSTLQHAIQQLEKVKKQYERAFKDAERSVEAYRKADADHNLSRADVEKAKNTMHQKQTQCETCKKEYAAELQKTNHIQHEHYHSCMPTLLQQMEQTDRGRIGKTSELITFCSKVERDVVPIINTCIDGIAASATTINADEDVRLIVDRYKTGLSPPPEHQFDDLGDPGSGTHPQPHSTPRVQRSETFKPGGTQSSGKGKPRKGLFGIFSSSKQNDEAKEDFSHLPPQQQKKKLQEQIEKLHEKIKNKTSERDGLQKLHEVYVANNNMGDPATLQVKLSENAKELDSLNQQLNKFQSYLAEAGQNLHDSHNNLQRKMSNLSHGSGNTGSNPGTPVQSRYRESGAPTTGRGSPDSGVGNSQQHQSFHDNDDSFDAADEDYKILGSAKALYSFDAPSDGSIPIVEGEIFHVIEADLGDGWTRVRKDSGDEGFVPTSYLQITMDETS